MGCVAAHEAVHRVLPEDGTMNYESLGACGSAGVLDGRAIAELQLGIAFLTSYVGAPPPGCRLEIVYHEHELGEYATIGLCWDAGTLGPEEWQYYRSCERALFVFGQAVDWSALSDIMWELAEVSEPEEKEE